MTPDKFDSQILNILKENARCSANYIANNIGLSRSAVAERIRKLEKSGIILGYHTQIKKTQHDSIKVFLHLSLDQPDCSKTFPFLTSFNEVSQVDSIAGDEIDYIVQVNCDSLNRLEKIRDEIAAMPNLRKLVTYISLSRRTTLS